MFRALKSNYAITIKPLNRVFYEVNYIIMKENIENDVENNDMTLV